MRYLVYRKYIKAFRYIREKEEFYKGFDIEDKLGKRGKEAKSILESRGGIVWCFPCWEKNYAIIDNVIIEYEDKKSQIFWTVVGIIISLCTLLVTFKTLLIIL